MHVEVQNKVMRATNQIDKTLFYTIRLFISRVKIEDKIEELRLMMRFGSHATTVLGCIRVRAPSQDVLGSHKHRIWRVREGSRRRVLEKERDGIRGEDSCRYISQHNFYRSLFTTFKYQLLQGPQPITPPRLLLGI
jgi:hypothetical protein